jgi:hypothetical protein
MQRTLVRLAIGLCLTASAFGIAAGVGVGIAGALPIHPGHPGHPGQPASVQTLAQSHQIQVSWTAPRPGTSAITRYEARAQSGTVSFGCATATTTCTITGVTPGIRYSVQVKAKNLSGFGY